MLQRISPLLQVADLAASIDYYARLGFAKRWESEGFCILARDECDLFLAQKEVPVDLRNATAKSQADGYADYDLHFHCSHGSIDSLWAEFTAAGAVPDDLCPSPEDRVYGIRDFSIKDLDGYRLVFGAPIEG
jgi:hypothetical protein